MCANIDRIKSLIIDNLANLDSLLCDWERRCVLYGDNRHHFLAIRSHIDKVRYHVEEIRFTKKIEEAKTPEKTEDIKVMKTEIEEVVNKSEQAEIGDVVCKTEEVLVDQVMERLQTDEMVTKIDEKVVNIPAEVIEEKVMEEKTKITFRKKDIRKAPSWKYLDKWNQILDEQWSQYKNNNNNNININSNNNQEDCKGVNIIVPNRIQTFAGTKKQRFNSTECILDEIGESNLEQSHKRYMSESALFEDFDIIMNNFENRQILDGPGYLLSLRDLQSFDKLDDLDDLSLSTEESDSECDIHKPRIVGVIYKDKL